LSETATKEAEWAYMVATISNPVYTETEKPGNPGFFSKPKNRFLAACKSGFSVLNFYLQRLITRPY